jgi:uncharacterized membrane protein
MQPMPYLGEILALLAPVSWSTAVILFRKTGRHVPPLTLNLFKNALAVVLFAITAMALRQDVLRDERLSHYALLLASGAIGIGLSDLFFFMTLNRVGAGLQAIINTTYSPAIIALSVLFLGERLSLGQSVGVAFILVAVLSVSWMRGPRRQFSRRTLVTGVLFGVAASVTQAVSIVMIKPLLEVSPLMWSNAWRLVGGLATSSLLIWVFPSQRRGLLTLRKVEVWPVMIPAAVIGTYVSLIFWLGGMKYTQASTASALNQTATLWTFALAAIVLKEPVTWIRVAGLAAGFGGVILVTFG